MTTYEADICTEAMADGFVTFSLMITDFVLQRLNGVNSIVSEL